MIGIFDSGLGGLTALSVAKKLLPKEDFIYLGDTGRVPYGTRSQATVCRYTREALAFFCKKKVDAVLIACGTASSVALPTLEDYPFPVFGVVKPTASCAVNTTKNGKIGVIGTSATVKSGAFSRAIHALNPSIETHAIACPLFVPFVENGLFSKNDPLVIELVRRYLAPLHEKGCDTLILGCTHFPILSEAIRAVFPNFFLINSGECSAHAIKDYFAFSAPSSLEKTAPHDKYDENNQSAESIENTQSTESVESFKMRKKDKTTASLNEKTVGSLLSYVTDNPENFDSIASIFLGENFPLHAQKIDLGKE